MRFQNKVVVITGAARGIGYAIAQRFAREGAMVGVHLDHGQSVEMANRAADCGYTSVMLDRSAAALADNISGTSEVLAHAHALGVAVEAEIGELLNNAAPAGSAATGNLVDPSDVQRFLSGCPVDMLAVGIGRDPAGSARQHRNS